MNRPPAKGAPGSPRRPAPLGRSSSYGRSSSGRSAAPGRLARPGRPPRGNPKGPGWPYLILALLVVLALYGGYTFMRARQGGVDPQARALAATAPVENSPSVTPTVALTPTTAPSPTRPVVAAAAVPGAEVLPGDAAPAITPTGEAAGQATPAAAAVTAVPAVPSNDDPSRFDQSMLQKRMLELVNKDRQDNGLRPVEWDDAATTAGQRHAEEMASLGYMSHWDINGNGPEYRYSEAGGLDFAQENVYRLVYTWEGGAGAPIADWDKVVRDAETAWMGSPGHRANILTPEHTGLGVGIAYEPESGTVAIAQEFVNHYVTRDPLPRRARPGDRIVLRGKLLPGSTSPSVNIGYEPFRKPMTLEELNKTGTYTLNPQPNSVPPVRVGPDGSFVAEHALEAGARPGLYHVLVWVNVRGARDKVLAVDAVIDVQ